MNETTETQHQARKWRLMLESLREADAWVVPGGLLRGSEPLHYQHEWPFIRPPVELEKGLQLVREISGIRELPPLKVMAKVRLQQFGNAVRAVPHPDWNTGVFLDAVRNGRDPAVGLLLLGFAQEAQPFARELAALPDRHHPTVHLCWPDPHGRDVSTFAAVWVPEVHHS